MEDMALSFYNPLGIKTIRKAIYVFYNKSNSTEMYKEEVTGFIAPARTPAMALILGD